MKCSGYYQTNIVKNIKVMFFLQNTTEAKSIQVHIKVLTIVVAGLVSVVGLTQLVPLHWQIACGQEKGVNLCSEGMCQISKLFKTNIFQYTLLTWIS